MFTKKTILPVLFLVCFAALFALNSPTPIDGVGYFGGELATYANGETIIYVYLNTDATGDVGGSQLKFCISVDGGVSWQEQTIPADIPHMIEPTLTPWEDGWLVNAGQIFKDEDGSGDFELWTIDGQNLFNSEMLECTPYVFDRGGDLAQFRTKTAYPEWRQYDFTVNGTEDILLRPYHHFSQSENSVNETNLYWTGYNLATEPVITSGDLKIKQTGGGSNNGWPTFLAPVLVGGEVLSSPANYPFEFIFQGGLWENLAADSGHLPFVNPARETGIHLGGQNPGRDIFLIEVDGSSYSGWHGVVSEPREVEATVYDEYPPAGEPLYTNTFTVCDTLWTPAGGGVCLDSEFFVDGELWIKGDFQGRQSWTSSGDLKIIGDITLRSTPAGSDPAGNTEDFVNLLSERNIEIKYGYKDPADNVRIHPMCGPDAQPHYIYANLYATGDGPREGVFTFEYQHPHPSTPTLNVTIENDDGNQEEVTFDWIDLHRRRYPPTSTQPWPSPALGQTRLDLPWYNPLWPEAEPYLERGTLEIWGNTYQRKRGFLHRSHNDSEYPSNSGVWDVEYDKCGYPTYPVNILDPVLGDIGLMSRNYPGAAGGGVGYKVQRYADPRWEFYRAADDFYSRFWGHGIQINTSQNNYQDIYKIAAAGFNEAKQSKCMDARDGSYAYAANDILLYDDGGDSQINLSGLTRDQGLILNVQITLDHHLVLHQHRRLDSEEGFTVITEIDPASPAQILSSHSYPSHYQRMPEAFCLLPDGRRMLVRFVGGLLELNEVMANGTLQVIGSLDISDTMYTHGRLSMKAASNHAVDLFYWENISESAYNGVGQIHHYRLQVPVSTDDPSIPALTRAQISAYPNPAHQAVNIEMKIPAHGQHSLDIFNIKGQKIRRYHSLGAKSEGEYNLQWDLKDEKRNPVSRGVYILRLKVDGKETVSKRITIQ